MKTIITLMLLVFAVLAISPNNIEAACKCKRLKVAPYLSFEIGQGLAMVNGLNPYTFSGRLNPTLAFGEDGRIRVAGVFGPALVNPNWDFMRGIRVSYRVLKFPIDLGGLDVAAEAVWGVQRRDLLTLGVTLDLGSVLFTSARVGSFYEAGIGVYVKRPRSKSQGKIPVAENEPTVYDEIRERTRTRFIGLFLQLVDNELLINCEEVRKLDEIDKLTTVASADDIKNNLFNIGLDEYAAGIDQVISDSEQSTGVLASDNQEVTAALKRGIREAVAAAYEGSYKEIQN